MSVVRAIYANPTTRHQIRIARVNVNGSRIVEFDTRYIRRFRRLRFIEQTRLISSLHCEITICDWLVIICAGSGKAMKEN